MHLLVREYSRGIGGMEKAEMQFVEWMFDAPEGPGVQLQACDPTTSSPNQGVASDILQWEIVNFNWALGYVEKV